MTLSDYVTREFHSLGFAGFPLEEVLEDFNSDTEITEHIIKTIETMKKLIGETAWRDDEREIEEGLQTRGDLFRVESEQDRRFLKFIALYHDLGRAVSAARHDLEGADLIRDEPLMSFRGLGINVNQINLFQELIRYHATFGPLSTGEASYLLFMDVLHPVTNLALAGGQRNEFLRFALMINIADIGARGFLDDEKVRTLLYDFEKLKEVDENLGDFSHRTSDNIFEALFLMSVNHTIERLRRLARNSLGSTRPWFVANDIEPILYALNALGISKDFCSHFAGICKLDYGLDLFKRLIQRMILLDSSGQVAMAKRNAIMPMIKVIDNLIRAFGRFTSPKERIILEMNSLFPPLRTEESLDMLVRKLAGESGTLAQEEAHAKVRNETLLWVLAI